jgi:hypothetical protein
VIGIRPSDQPFQIFFELEHEGRMFNFKQVQAVYIDIYKFSENVNA